MPLILSTLVDEISKFADQDSLSFTGSPDTIAEAATKWGNAINTYTLGIIPPSTTQAAAKTALISTMNTISTESGNGLIVLQSALTSYAATLAAGMQPAFTATPPPIPLDITFISVLGLGGASNDYVISTLCSSIHVWFKTGIAVNNSSGVTVNWN